ncbi:Transcription factor TFIIE, alpha subunit [Trifolium repens]|nr:Transcription factor TFIIE, alpha subunit [Trifolium repens]
MELSMMILPEKVIINPKREGVTTEKLLWFLMPSPEEDLAKDLKLHTKQLRRTMRFFEEEKIITRDHQREEIQWIRPQQLIFQDDDASLMGHNNISEIICTTNAGEYDIPTNLGN